MGAGRARRPGNNPHAHGGWSGPEDQDAGKVLLDRGARGMGGGEAGSIGGEGGGGKWRVVRGHCYDAGAGSALRFLEGTLSRSRPSPPPPNPRQTASPVRGLARCWLRQGGTRAGTEKRASVRLEEARPGCSKGQVCGLKQDHFPPPPSSPPLSRRRGGGRRGRRRCRAKRSRIGSPRLSTA